MCPEIRLKQPQQYATRICNFTRLGSLKRDHIKYHFQRGERESEKEIKKRFVCQSIPTHSISLVQWKRWGKKGSGSAFCKSSDEMLTKQPIFCNFPATLFQQLTQSEPLHFKQQHTATSDMYLVPGFFGRGRKTKQLCLLRSGGRCLRSRLHKGCLCFPNRHSWAQVKG